MRYAVVGAGAIGGTVAAYLARAGQPLLLVGTPAYTFSDTIATATDSLGVFSRDGISEEQPLDQYYTKMTASITPRRVRPMQEVIDDTTPRLVKPGDLITIPLESDNPLRSVELTDAGAQFYPYLRDGFDRIAQGAALVSRAARTSVQSTSDSRIRRSISAMSAYGLRRMLCSRNLASAHSATRRGLGTSSEDVYTTSSRLVPSARMASRMLAVPCE